MADISKSKSKIRLKFKMLIERNRWFKHVPNALTLCNSLCGFAAILSALQLYRCERPEQVMDVMAVGAWIIICAMVFDALDGFAARVFNAASMHGLQMDSLADMVTFGVAPAVSVAIMAHSLRSLTVTNNFIIYALCAIYLGCAALRLATYNVHAILEKKSGEKFTGLPSPGAAAAICSLIIFYADYPGPVTFLAFAAPIYAAVVGLLMVSNIPYQHIGKWLFSVRRNKNRLIILLLCLALVAVTKSLGILIIVNLYIFSGPIVMIFTKIRDIILRPAINKSTLEN
jgi:CDP-diacylglycerol--serine O-phosphatidyltransferase